jgi:hypothetical protein
MKSATGSLAATLRTLASFGAAAGHRVKTKHSPAEHDLPLASDNFSLLAFKMNHVTDEGAELGREFLPNGSDFGSATDARGDPEPAGLGYAEMWTFGGLKVGEHVRDHVAQSQAQRDLQHLCAGQGPAGATARLLRDNHLDPDHLALVSSIIRPADEDASLRYALGRSLASIYVISENLRKKPITDTFYNALKLCGATHAKECALCDARVKDDLPHWREGGCTHEPTHLALEAVAKLSAEAIGRVGPCRLPPNFFTNPHMKFFGPVPVGSFRHRVENALRGHVRVPFNSGWVRDLLRSDALLPHQRQTLDETLTARALAHGFTDLPRDSNVLVDGITIQGTTVMIRGPVGPPQATVSLWRVSSLLRCYSGPDHTSA